MDARRWFTVWAGALLGAALIGCRGDNAGRPAAEAGARSQAVAQPEAPTVAPAAAPVSVAAEAKAACAGVALFWGSHDSTSVRQVDSLVKPYVSDTAVSACVVLVYQPHGNRRDARAPVDTEAQHLETALALVRGAGPGWVPLYHYGADGPDGSDLAYQRGRVRCLVERSWEGEDDSDSTYVPADWFKEVTSCWLMPGLLTAADTAMGQ